MRSLPRQARWAVPIGAVAAVGLAIAGSALAGAQAAPRLPARSTAQLLAAAGAPSARPPAMTAVVQETASLGLPSLPGSADALSPLSLLSGTHTFTIWYDGPARVRIAVPVTLGETDLRRDGRDVWFWNSRTSQATHYVLPAGSVSTPEQNVPAPNAPTPQQVAGQILAAAGATTTVGLQPDVMVAGRAAYQLSLAPRDDRSLIGQVKIAIDAQNGLPLRVQVFARGAPGPALQVGYTSISFGRPAASNFAFTAPPGAKVKTITIPNVAGVPGAVPGPPFPGVPIERLRSQGGRCSRPGNAGTICVRDLGTPGGEVLVYFNGSVSASGPGGGWVNTSASAVPVPVMTGGPGVIGHDWLSVLVLPAGLPAGGLPGGDTSGLGVALLGAARPVHGAWGSGRLLRTSLVSVLITSSGQVLIGAVQPSVLFADAAQLR